MINKLKHLWLANKTKASILLVIVLMGSYFTYKHFSGGSTATRYVLASVEKGTIVSSISGSGQISASDQVDVKSKVSGDVIYALPKSGQALGMGAIIAQLDAGDAQKAVRDAQINLENAQISLSKLQISQKNNAPKLEYDIKSAQANLDQAYQSGTTEISNAFLDLPSVMDKIRGIIFDSTVGGSGQSNTGAYENLMDSYGLNSLVVLINKATEDYQTAFDAYQNVQTHYRQTSALSSSADITSLVRETLQLSKTMSQAIKDEQNMLDTVVGSIKQFQPNRPIPSAITQYQSDIATYTSKLNSHTSSLTNISNSIDSNQQNLDNAQRSLDSSSQGDPLDVASQENSVKQRQAALDDAKSNLANYYIRAPFSGVLAKINVKRGDSVSGATAVATMISNQKIAEISLNEVDVSKINLGDKVTMTFDAITDLSVTGSVVDIDTIGTVTQGVVTYGVKIGLDTQDTRIKSGMSVSAAIITDVKTDVLTISSSALKSAGGNSYVQVVDKTADLQGQVGSTSGVALGTAPKQQAVQIGISSDSAVEVSSGLQEGDIVVVRTITSSTTTSQATTKSLFPTTGGNRTGGANIGRTGPTAR